MNSARTRYRSPFTSEHFSIEGGADSVTNPHLAEYLRSARTSIENIQGPGSLHARLAHFPQVSFVSISSPPAKVSWQRTPKSLGRIVLLLSRVGTFTLSSEDGYILRGQNAALIAPGASPLSVQMTATTNELIYVSAPADVLPAGMSGIRTQIDRKPLSWTRLAPLYLFIDALAKPTPHGTRDDRAYLAHPALAVAVSLAAAIAHDVPASTSLHDRACDFMGTNHANSNLTLSSVADHLGVATRTLQASFAENDATFSRVLRDLRVSALRQTQLEQPGLPPSALATMCGFTSMSSMYRGLRAVAHEAVAESESALELQEAPL